MLYDILIKNGLLIDPAQGINEEKDIAILNGEVVAVESNISKEQATKTIDASGLIVTAGLIDIHVHCTAGLTSSGLEADSTSLKAGCTTVLDVGSTGEAFFHGFRKYVIDRSETRIFALINIESLGMITHNQEWPKLLTELNERLAPMFVNIDSTVKIIKENQDVILGIKWAHHGLKLLELAREAADKANCLIMAENHHQPSTLKYMKKGDVITHLYHNVFGKRPWIREHDGLLNENETIQQEFYDAVKRGVIMDVGHGRLSFEWDTAETAFKQGFRPDTISTDVWEGWKQGIRDMPTVMSKFLHLGMSLEEVVKASTMNPAEVIGSLGLIGTLKPGACADVTVMRLTEGKFQLSDSVGYGNMREVDKLLKVNNVIRRGKVIF